MDEYITKNTQTLDLAQRKAAYDEVARIWSEQLPEIDLIARHWACANKNRVKNVRPTILPPYNFWNVDELYLTK